MIHIRSNSTALPSSLSSVLLDEYPSYPSSFINTAGNHGRACSGTKKYPLNGRAGKGRERAACWYVFRPPWKMQHPITIRTLEACSLGFEDADEVETEGLFLPDWKATIIGPPHVRYEGDSKRGIMRSGMLTIGNAIERSRESHL